MQLLKDVPQYNSNTGELDGTSQQHPIGVICDYCGRVWEDLSHELVATSALHMIFEPDDLESQFDAIDWSSFNFDGDIYKLFADQSLFFYCRDYYEGQYCDAEMMVEFGDSIRSGKGDFIEKSIWPTLDEVMYIARMRMVTRLVFEGKFSLADLGLSKDEE